MKSTKYHLRRVLREAMLTFEGLYTVLTLIEACLNSRLLYQMTRDPCDLSVLTPAHFLIGGTMNSVREYDLTNQNVNRLTRWERVQEISQQFWRRWQAEYLPQLQSRVKWTRERENVKIDALVLIKHDSLPPSQWCLGRITEIHPGRGDGKVRAVTVRSRNGQLKRCISKICKLPIS